jgi:hypothetical protein
MKLHAAKKVFRGWAIKLSSGHEIRIFMDDYVSFYDGGTERLKRSMWKSGGIQQYDHTRPRELRMGFHGFQRTVGSNGTIELSSFNFNRKSGLQYSNP